jgi:transcriptional regulator with XRE-family HTH domain
MENLKKIREAKNITQLRLSIEIGVAQETISGYELGKTMPSITTLTKMADFLNTSTDYLLGKTDITTPINNLLINELNAEEAEIVSMFKSLNKNDQSKVIGYISALKQK